MRGIVHLGGGEVVVTDELEVRGPGPTEVAVRLEAAGVCHSDLSVLDGTIPFPTPVVCGHEGAGVVEEVGSAVHGVAPGDHVVVSTLASCGRCPACAAGYPTRCRSSIGNITQPFTFRGKPAYNFAATSSFAERIVVDAVQAVPISADVPFTSACLIACGVITGVGAVLNRARVQTGETAAVFGVGGVGLNVVQALRLVGASRIVAVDANPAKEALARAFGATDFVLAAGRQHGRRRPRPFPCARYPRRGWRRLGVRMHRDPRGAQRPRSRHSTGAEPPSRSACPRPAPRCRR